MWLGLCAYVALMVDIAFEVYHDSWEPTPQPLTRSPHHRSSHIQRVRSSEDDVARVREYLVDLVAIGPRVIGSPGLDEATAFLMHTLERLRDSYASDGLLMEVDLQRPSGHFDTLFLDGLTNVYSSVSNVVVRLSSVHASNVSAPSVLVNAHFDTVPTSAGASDDGIGCAVMLGAIENLLAEHQQHIHSTLLSVPIIFLFNGAEESHQIGSHGFISQHKWGTSVRYLVNLEAIGGGGRELIFQCNSAQFIQLYARSVPYPKGSVIAHELFKAVLWKSAATDWRTVIQYSKSLHGVIGVDSAYINNGHIYHTFQDSLAFVSNGTILNTLSNLEGLLDSLQSFSDSAYSPSTHNDKGDEVAVFFTIPGLLFVAYSGTAALLLHTLLGVAGLLYSLTSSYLTISAVVFELGVFLLAVSLGALLGALGAIVCPMRWYAYGIPIALFTYAPPCVAVVLALKQVSLARILLTMPSVDHTYAPLSASSHEVAKGPSTDPVYACSCRALVALIFAWSVALLALTLLGVMSGYIAGFFLVFGMLGDVAFKYVRASHSHSAAYSAYLVCVLPCLLHWLELLHGLLLMLLPLLGKSGTLLAPDIVVGIVVAALSSSVVQMMCAHASMRISPSKTSNSRRVILALCVLYMAGLLFIASLSPYSASHPKRLWLQHITRDICSSSSCTSDSGLWLTAFDGLGLQPLRDLRIPCLDGRYDAKPCRTEDGECYAWFPWSAPVAHLMRDSFLIPADLPDPPPKHKLQLAYSSTALPDGLSRRITVTVTGPSHLRLVLRDGSRGSRLQCWVLTPDTVCRPPPLARFDGSRYIQLTCGDNKEEACSFTVALEVTGVEPIQVTAHADYSMLDSTALVALRQQLPQWARGAEWTNFVSALVQRLA